MQLTDNRFCPLLMQLSMISSNGVFQVMTKAIFSDSCMSLTVIQFIRTHSQQTWTWKTLFFPKYQFFSQMKVAKKTITIDGHVFSECDNITDFKKHLIFQSIILTLKLCIQILLGQMSELSMHATCNDYPVINLGSLFTANRKHQMSVSPQKRTQYSCTTWRSWSRLE